jgi:hypothetical protein
VDHLEIVTTSGRREEEVDCLEKALASRGQKRNMTILRDLQLEG